MAKFLRDIEIENGGTAPRIHSMDEYFMAEVEKVEENGGSRSSGSVRGKKQAVKKVMEYCYEPEMEEAYRSSMLKAFKKTLDDGAFPFVIAYACMDMTMMFLFENTFKFFRQMVSRFVAPVCSFTWTDIDQIYELMQLE